MGRRCRRGPSLSRRPGRRFRRFPVLREDDTAALSLRDCAALAPGDSPVVLVELTGAELRQWLDRSAEAYQAEPDGSISGGEGANVLYGMDYALYLGASEGQRVDGLAFEGALVDDGRPSA